MATSSLTPFLEYVILVGLFVGILIIRQIVNKFGASIMGKLFKYFLIGTILLFAMRLFVHLVDVGTLQIADGSREFWWHIIFYLALISFYFGLKGLVNLAEGKENKIAENVGKWSVFSLIAAIVIFILASTTGSSLAGFYENPIFSSFGLHHFIAFGLACLIVYYLLQTKEKIGMIGAGIARPFMLSLLFWGLQHLWELLGESWKIVQVTDFQIERVEQYLVIPAVCILIYTLLQLKKVTGGSTNKSN